MTKQRLLGSLSLVALSLMATSCGEEVQATKGAKNYKTLFTSLSNTTIESKYTAAIRGEQYVDIRPQVTGQITQILIQEGAEVKKGQALFIIDQVPYKAALDVASANVLSAKSSVATAELNAASNQELYGEGIISQTELQISLNTLESAKAALALAEAQETNAKSDLSYTVVKSPVDGVASMISYRVGALVSSSITDPLVSVTDNDNMYAYFSMSESQILSLTQESGSTSQLLEDLPSVDLVLNNGTTYSHQGSVDAISGTIDRTTGSVAIRAIFENPEKILRDGGNGTVLIDSKMDSVILIPKIATFEIQNKIFVYKVIDNKTVSSEIEVYPFNNGTEYIVIAGLTTGEEIIAEGAGLLRDGEAVGRGNSGDKNQGEAK
ncbi:MAG: efflux RND transporter periplasmic adaptor subunit [Rikenellaceae bacterium]